jgi:hypothetical protein
MPADIIVFWLAAGLASPQVRDGQPVVSGEPLNTGALVSEGSALRIEPGALQAAGVGSGGVAAAGMHAADGRGALQVLAVHDIGCEPAVPVGDS